MTGSLRRVQQGLVLSAGLLLGGQLYAEETMKTNYTVSFNANDALCLVKVNDMLVTNNGGMGKGQLTLGQTVSSYLQNGQNTLSIAMLHKPVHGGDKLPDDMWCSAKIQDARQDGTDEYVAAVKLIVRDGRITPDTGYYTGQYTSFGDSPRADRGEKMTREVSQSFHAADLPEWPWVNARPVTEDDIPAVKAFYESLQNDFKRQDLPAIYQKTRGMWESLATEQGSTPEKMWKSMNYKGYFERGYKATPIDWSEFKFSSYMGGRIFRFEKGYVRSSPLKIRSSENKSFSPTPYLSIIDGKVTVVN
ncbi:TPA: hypothetical protein I8W54_003471 [Morganella morganii]|uniref:hypothetical protein n=2 Tax=Morganella morganii TaxID=582 RepID=UPI001A2D7DA5|nr:hypothetical protein [Morganella morganii]MCU6273989.1 hypothetical protein [Morganella morganii]HAT1515097.1 hypothetical protein [Morganella morganii]